MNEYPNIFVLTWAVSQFLRCFLILYFVFVKLNKICQTKKQNKYCCLRSRCDTESKGSYVKMERIVVL